MAVKTVLVCDRCGAGEAERVQLVIGGRRLVTDLCSRHLSELTSVVRSPGRRSPRAGTASSRSPRRRRVPARPAAKGRQTSASKRTARRRRPPSDDGYQDVTSEVGRLRSEGLTYRQIGDALMERGVKPTRAARWNPIVLSRMAKRAGA